MPGHPDATFPTLAEVEDRAATIAAAWTADAPDDAGRAAVLDAVARGAAVRASLYASLRELVFPDATEVD